MCRCAASSAMSGIAKRNRSWSKACGVWNIAATTAPASPRLTGPHLHLRKRAGRIADLANYLRRTPAPGCHGISHTRWATHGPANDRNAHPHLSRDGTIAVVHNGVIENYSALKRQLQDDGVTFHSDTDTEVIAHLIAQHYQGDLVEAVRKVLGMLKGTYGLAVVSTRQPDLLVGARLGSPLVVGIGQNENFLASDPAALLGNTEKVVYLAGWPDVRAPRRQLARPGRQPRSHRCQHPQHRLGPGRRRQGRSSSITCSRRSTSSPKPSKTPCAAGSTTRTPAPISAASISTPANCAGPSASSSPPAAPAIMPPWSANICSRSSPAFPVEVEYASEFRYRNPPMERNTIVLAITQSGETADTLAALRESKRKGHHTLALCNVVGSTIAREADGGVYLHAGPEIGVASTKAFTNQVAVLTMLALYMGRMRHLSSLQGQRMIKELKKLPDVIRTGEDVSALSTWSRR